MPSEHIEAALSVLKKGGIVYIYDADDREGESDIVVASQFVTPKVIRTMRKEGGGLICATITKKIADTISLPFMTDIMFYASEKYPLLREIVPNDIPYDEKSSFSITINARDTFTGITDIDRAKTIKHLSNFIARVISKDIRGDYIHEFGTLFRSPGHVPLLITSDKILETRFGHTELATALVIMAGLVPSATICEIMGDDGYAKNKGDAQYIAKRKGIVFLEGYEIVEAWKQWFV